MTPQEVRNHVGKQVELRIAPAAGPPSVVRGRILGALEAADGLVVTVEPEGAGPRTRLTVHYHHILALRAL